jgi:hypothetical protein
MLLRVADFAGCLEQLAAVKKELPIGRLNLLEARGAGTSELHDNNDHRPPSSLMDLFQIQPRAPLFFMHIPKTASMNWHRSGWCRGISVTICATCWPAMPGCW